MAAHPSPHSQQQKQGRTCRPASARCGSLDGGGSSDGAGGGGGGEDGVRPLGLKPANLRLLEGE